ncbi:MULTISPECIES: M23 family metallopeptidase [Stenotrophomonas]|uniref:M23 family metallopeptidase n=1 Tax=Stenotrophomonas TaxID=40323 RepID=UPI00106F9581|nr:MULTISPECIES: M23 family metallopeptidase [Stenotrophomonas]MBA0400915.1 M23 family metallopeptidase [Stenotrophomonas maltophilia]MCV0220781.1 M23 family metallopeptidase [Stenotrophomonas sp. Ps181]MDT3433101.1 M23 family metallopeptidase [Stenotrophomonas maltophilia]HDS1551575.1 M23 family metallopeptidase [Stenotrophomonas maltophilia]
MRLSQLIVLGVLLGLGAGWWLHRDAGEPVAASLPEAPSTVAAAPVTEPVAPGATAPPASNAPPAAQAPDAPPGLLLPVQGILPSQLRDTFTDARSEGRVHDAIDIMADAGTPVLAAADGTVEKLFDSERGGLTIYQFEPSGRWCYYYAHLQRYADGLAEKQVIRRGDVIGYVGSTGNASAEAPHLHFEVHVLGPEKQWWKGQSINPYPLLKSAAPMPGAASAATPK